MTCECKAEGSRRGMRGTVPMVVASMAVLVLLVGDWRTEGGGKKGYELQGTLFYKMPLPMPDVQESHHLDTMIELLKSKTLYYEGLNRRFKLAIAPAAFAKMFKIAKVGDGNVIRVSLIWPDKEQGAALVNALMEIHCTAMAQERKAVFQKVIDRVNKDLAVKQKAAQDAIAARDKKVGPDAKETLAAIKRRLLDKEDLRDKAKAEFDARKFEIVKLNRDLDEAAKLQDKVEGKADPAFEQQRQEALIGQQLAKADLSKLSAQLKAKKSNLPHVKKNAEDGLIPYPHYVAFKEEIEDLQRGVKTAELVAAIRKLQYNELRPGNAKRNEILSKLHNRETQQVVTTLLLNSYEEHLTREIARSAELQRILQDVAPLHARIAQAEEVRRQLREKLGRLARGAEDVGTGIRISSQAAAR